MEWDTPLNHVPKGNTEKSPGRREAAQMPGTYDFKM